MCRSSTLSKSSCVVLILSLRWVSACQESSSDGSLSDDLREATQRICSACSNTRSAGGRATYLRGQRDPMQLRYSNPAEPATDRRTRYSKQDSFNPNNFSETATTYDLYQALQKATFRTHFECLRTVLKCCQKRGISLNKALDYLRFGTKRLSILQSLGKRHYDNDTMAAMNCVNLLLKHGARTDAQDALGCTVLHVPEDPADEYSDNDEGCPSSKPNSDARFPYARPETKLYERLTEASLNEAEELPTYAQKKQTRTQRSGQFS